MSIPRKSSETVPFVTTETMMEVDRLMAEVFGIQMIQMLENAGRNLTELARSMLKGNVEGKRIVVLVGAGNNGGGGMVAARHLHNGGARVTVIASFQEERLEGIPLQQWSILERMDVERILYSDSATPSCRSRIRKSAVVLDALVGYGLKGDPQGSTAELIRLANASRKRTISLDLPSGVEGTSGKPRNPSINAVKTLTLALPKEGLRTKQIKKKMGRLYVADIGVPPALYRKLKLEVPSMFGKSSIVELQT